MPHVPRLAVVINLNRRRDRWRSISARLHANVVLQRYSIERLHAVDGQTSLDFAQLVHDGHLRQRAFESVMAKGRRVWGQEMTVGALGCLLSHAKAWERAAYLNESVLVFEDDVELLLPAFEQLYSRALEELPANFGLLYLGDMAKDESTIRKTDYSPSLKRISRPLWGLYAYVVSPLAARRLLLHMFPADVQADSYVRQVFAAYVDASSMPSFVVAQDIVYTDNSESRDTDAQMPGLAVKEQAEEGSSRYHVLLPRSSLSSLEMGRKDNAPKLLEFDRSYFADSMEKTARPDVDYYTEETALNYAWERGLITTSSSRSESKRLTYRWLLCLAIALHHGGMCFTEPYVVVRSIHHLLRHVHVGIFMANSKDAGVLLHVAYVSPKIPRAIVSRFAFTVQRYFADGDRATIAKSRDIVMLPPHMFDPLLPLRRPCRCDHILLPHLRGCQSRCDRRVAPPYAAGYLVARARSSRASNQAFQLHAVLPPPNGSVDSAKAKSNLRTWTRMHAAATWKIHTHESDAFDRVSRRIVNLCVGLSAVARHGGVYVDMGRAPRQPLLDGALSEWSRDADINANQTGRNPCHQLPVVTMWARNENYATLITDSSKNLSWRFFAAPCPDHPVATRLASACAHKLHMIRGSDAGMESANLARMFLLQLQQVLADDAWSVQFFDEQIAFASPQG